MNINEEGKYYAEMVRKYRTEYGSKNLHGFCKYQKVSYTKMLHCLRNESYRRTDAALLNTSGEQGLHPLVVDSPEYVSEELSAVSARNDVDLSFDDIELRWVL